MLWSLGSSEKCLSVTYFIKQYLFVPRGVGKTIFHSLSCTNFVISFHLMNCEWNIVVCPGFGD
jgi:hypothetical protein